MPRLTNRHAELEVRDRSKEVVHLNRVATTGSMSAWRRSRDRDAGDLNDDREALHILELEAAGKLRYCAEYQFFRPLWVRAYNVHLLQVVLNLVIEGKRGR